MTNLSKPLVVTSGEPAGIGPELCLALAASPWAKQIVVVADPEMLAERAHLLDHKVALCNYEAGSSRNGSLQVLPQPLENPAVCGTLDPGNARSLLDGIERAVSGCQRKWRYLAPLRTNKFGLTDDIAPLTDKQNQ
jgi:4-hydroxythreonine-4-phosphate dehydrogenase